MWVPTPHDPACSLAADRAKVSPSVRSGPRLHPHVAALHSLSPLLDRFLPSSRLGNGESPESWSSRCKLNYIHQPGASTIVPRAFPALIRIFLFSLREGGQPISTSITLPAARNWNCRAHAPTDGAASRRWGGGVTPSWMGAPQPSFSHPRQAGMMLKLAERTQQEVSLKRTHACMYTHTHTHTQSHGG